MFDSIARDGISAWSVYSVWYRHAKRFRASWKVNCLPPISETLMYLLGFGYGMGPLVKEVVYNGQSVSYFTFITPGMIAVGVLFQSFFEGAYGTFIRVRYQMTWQAMLTAPVTFTEIFLGDWLWAATRGTLAGTLTGLAGVMLQVYSLSELFRALPIIVLGSLLFAAMGMFASGVVRTIDHINVPVFLIVVPMFAFCGTYFPRDVLPLPLKILAALLPLSALTDLLRSFIAPPASTLFSYAILITWLAVFGFFGARKLHAKLYS